MSDNREPDIVIHTAEAGLLGPVPGLRGKANVDRLITQLLGTNRRLRECQHCHRVGERGFVPFGDYGWVCIGERACQRRKAARRDRLS